ncbi:hypothetical protein [Azohydromonas aeria]|uniref:hypothetical protein n=1 Tax=Azohydromonas aeria TaxID=2590212 RepID=UPI0012F829CF|nr:hypothetical protein [Azohydromonas aeria]
MAQTLIVSLLVAWAGAYAAWVLMPAPLKRALRGWIQRHVPALARRMAPEAAGGCGGCGGGCGPGPGRKDAAGGAAAAEVKPIRLDLKRRS